MKMQFINARRPDRKGAILSMELVLILPIFLLLVFSIVEFSMLMSAHTRVANAAQSGSRMMCISGANESEVKERVTSLLGASLAKDCLIQVYPANYAGEIGRVAIRVPMRNASPDLLWMTGFSLQDRSIDADAPMVMERTASKELPDQY
jgi:Flp pilus assembly protein TadG